MRKGLVVWLVIVACGVWACRATPPVSERPSDFDPFAMVEVPAGVFVMGCVPKPGSLCDPDEYPPEVLFLDTVWIDRYEVSWRAWDTCVTADACPPRLESLRPHPSPHGDATQPNPGPVIREPDYPAVMVTQEEAAAFCAWQGKRLPTEAEWEKAARGADGRDFPWGDVWDPTRLNAYDPAWASDAGGGTVDGWPFQAPVYAFDAGRSPYGALNMVGNVAEWTADCYTQRYDALPPDIALRGGGWHLTYGDDLMPYRCSDRDNGYRADQAHDVIGFRCVADTLF